ncbi:MAG: VOC family protein [Bryobacterales bacterium]|nr:VOC family protein [Bryobacterales bacterium]MBV9399369.1 VOC family protein [Bryobacterales bacterium]
MQINPHLNFNGDCEAAFKLYEKALGGKTSFMMTYGESPAAEHMPLGFGKKIMHATFTTGDQTFYGADAPPDRYHKPAGFAVSIDLKDPAEADRIFAALSDGGTVQMPIQETFWASRFGMLVDQFGIPWMVNCGKPE